VSCRQTHLGMNEQVLSQCDGVISNRDETMRLAPCYSKIFMMEGHQHPSNEPPNAFAGALMQPNHQPQVRNRSSKTDYCISVLSTR
jgi:hypothetical protein